MARAGGAPRRRMTYRFVFFDAGETLLYPHPSFAELFALTVSEAGCPVTAEQVNAVRASHAPHLLDIAEESGIEKGPSLSPEDSRIFWTFLYRRFLEELGYPDESLVELLYATFSKSSTYRLYDDALPTLEILKARHSLGLISNFDEWLREMLVELEVGHLFEVAVISGIEGVEKPDASIYRLALERAGVDPSEAVHIGDSPGMDAEPAESVGMSAILLDRDARYPDAPWPTISSLRELPDLLAQG
ncbi:MAG TPA: HAD-IA family hydrolase [Actinomycetota bacterium]|nr:HAD-IA family hydrolase [Actinomycetota bacterium]